MINPLASSGRPKGWRPPLKRDIDHAIASTSSMEEAARFAGLEYRTFRRWAQRYGVWAPQPLSHRKRPRVTKSAVPLADIFANRHPKYSRQVLRTRLLAAGLKAHACELCGYAQYNPITLKVPLTLYPKDGNYQNYALENLELRCYNCTYVTSDKVSRPKDFVPHVDNQNRDLLSQLTPEELLELQHEVAVWSTGDTDPASP